MAPVLEILAVPVSNDQYERAVLMADKLVGMAYGLDDCIIGGITDIFGKPAGVLAENLFDWEGSVNCSAVYTLIFRAMFFDFLTDRDSSTITPQVAYEATLDLVQSISGEVRKIG